MEYKLLNSIDDGIKEAIAYKTKISSLQKMLDSYVSKEISNASNASKKFNFSSKSKFLDLKNDSFLGNTIKLYGEVESKRLTRKFQMCNEIKSCILNSYSEFLSKFPPINKMRQKLTNMQSHIKAAKAKNKELINEQANQVTYRESSTSAAGQASNPATIDVEVLQSEFMREAQNLKTLINGLLVDEKNMLTLIAKVLYFEKEYHLQCSTILGESIGRIKEKLNQSKVVFGIELDQHLKQEECQISHVINDCVNFLYQYGLDEIGIFREAAEEIKLKKLMAMFDAGLPITDDYVESNHTVANCLKKYLILLPNPLIPFDLYEDFKALVMNQSLSVKEVKNLLQVIPKSSYVNLRHLIKFLTLVAKNENINKMNDNNIGICIGPCLMRKDFSAGDKHDLSLADKDVVKFLVSNYNQLFGEIMLETNIYTRFNLSVEKLKTSRDNKLNSSTRPDLNQRFVASQDIFQTSNRPPYHVVNPQAYEKFKSTEKLKGSEKKQ